MNLFSEVKQHSWSEICGMAISFIWTRLLYPGAMLIRRPFYLRGSRRSLIFGKGFTTGRGCRFEIYGKGKIEFGEQCHIGDYVHLSCSNSIIIGNDCLFASKIFITDTSHGCYSGASSSRPITPPNDRPLDYSSTKIGDNVWLGDNVVVLQGTTIGNGCVIGANSTVTKDIPDNCIAVGSPAVPIKVYDFDLQEWRRINQ